MSYKVTLEGALPGGGGSESELQHVKDAVHNFYVELMGKGHSMTTAFVNDEPLNPQEDISKEEVKAAAAAGKAST